MALQDDVNAIKAQLNAEFPLRQITSVQATVPVNELAPTGSFIIKFTVGTPNIFERYENQGTLLAPYWKKSGGGEVTVTDIVFSALDAKIAAATLAPGNFYKILDHQTIHNIPNSAALAVNGTVYENPATWANTLSEGVEPLIVMAVTTSALSPVVYSPVYPNDIIQYDVTNKLCEDGVTPRKGKIIYRKDNVKNLETYYDWRKVRFRRYKIAPVAWVAGTTYAKFAVVLASNGDTYVSKRAGNVGNDPAATPTAGNAGAAEYAVVYGIWWEKAVLGVHNQYLGWSNTATCMMGSFQMPLNTADFQDYYTFNSTLHSTYHSVWLNPPTNTVPNPEYRVLRPLVKGDPGLMKSIKIGYHSTYNNIIFADQIEGGNRIFNNSFDDGCSNCLFYGVNISNNTIGKNSANTICQGSWYNNEFGSNFSTNYSIYMNQQYWWGMTHNVIGSNYTNNFHVADFNNNSILTGGNLSSNMWHYNTQRNTFQGFVYNTVFGYECCDNLMQFVNGCTIGFNFKSNQVITGADENKTMVSSTIGDNCMGNIIRSMYGCTVGLNFKNNIIEGVFKTLTIPNDFQWNKSFGTIAANTYFAVGCNRNVFNNDFGGGTAGVPLNLISCVFNKPVTGMQVASTSVILTNVLFNVAVTSKTLPLSLTNENVIYTSPDGSLWSSGIDDTGHLSPEKIV